MTTPFLGEAVALVAAKSWYEKKKKKLKISRIVKILQKNEFLGEASGNWEKVKKIDPRE